MRQLILDIRSDAFPDFHNFLPGPNQEALAALTQLSTSPSGESVVYLWGEAGVGKSHLLQAWATRARAPYFAHGALPEPDVWHLAVDDVAQLNADDQIRLFSLINAVREQGGHLIVAGNLPPNQLLVRADLATRLAQGLVFRLLPLADADKAQALAIRAEALGVNLPEDVIRHLLTHCRRDLPHLLTLVDGLDAFSLSRKRPVSLPLLKDMLAQGA